MDSGGTISTLTVDERLLVRLTGGAVLGRWDVVAASRASAPPGSPDRRWREAVLQLHLFAGVPRQLEACEVLERAGGLGPLDADEAAFEADEPGRGAALFARIYGRQASAVRARLASFHPDLEAWVIGHAYGRVLARPGLDAGLRELLAVAALAVLGQERQLASHARGAVAVGESPERVMAALDAVQDLLEPTALLRARAVVASFARAADRQP